MMTVEQRIHAVTERLQSLKPRTINVIDESHKHKGHAGAATGMSHFHIEIAADELDKKNRLVQHRLIYAALGDLINSELHAVRLTILE